MHALPLILVKWIQIIYRIVHNSRNSLQYNKVVSLPANDKVDMRKILLQDNNIKDKNVNIQHSLCIIPCQMKTFWP